MLSAGSEMTVILADNPMQISMLRKNYPRLMDCFKKHVAAAKEAASDINAVSKENVKQESSGVAKAQPENLEAAKSSLHDKKAAIQQKSVSSITGKGTSAVVESIAPEIRKEKPQKEEEMSIDEFAEYAANYAKSIDCAISGKSMLALYERIEIMEEDNIPLTKDNARDLIEQAADRAEKPGLGGKLKGIFSAKYDKDGMLILKEEHFVI